MKKVILGLGSNRSYNGFSPVQLLDLACKELEQILINPVFSSVYSSKAMYVTDQEDFYNMACLGFVSDDENPYDLLERIHQIENKYGRNRAQEIRFGPRSLDIDIEEFDNLVQEDPVLTLPHPRIKERAFVLIPLLELFTKSAEDLRKKEISESLAKLPNQGDVKLFRKNP